MSIRRSPQPLLTRRAFVRNSAFASAALAGTGLLAGCGSNGGSNGDSADITEETFLSYLPMETMSMAPELLAEAGGHFAAHGLEITVEEVQGSPQAMQTLISGVAPITRLGQLDLLTTMSESDQGLVNIGSLTRGPTQRIVYSTDNHTLENPEDFLDQVMGVPSEGGTSDMLNSLILASDGHDPERLERQVVGLSPGTFNLVQRGELAGYVVSLDTAVTLQAQHEDAGVFDPGTVMSSDSQVYVTTREALEEHEDVLRSFLAAIHDALAAVAADDDLDETVELLREDNSFASLDDDEIATTTLQQMRDMWTGGEDDPQPLLVTDEDAWAAGYEELVEAGLAEPGADPVEWIDNSLIPES
jgi:NitT/TauT family transport system substrate-binding protein